MGEATGLFTRHFLPLLVPGEWAAKRMDVGSWVKGFPCAFSTTFARFAEPEREAG